MNQFVRTAGGRVVHRHDCPHVLKAGATSTATPWLWAADRPIDQVRKAAIATGVRDCRHCRPYDIKDDFVKLTTSATVHYCDGCGGEEVQLKGADLPPGYYLDVTDLTGQGMNLGRLYVCGDKCIAAAFARRHDVWNHQ